MESICDEATSVMFSPSWITTTIIPAILKMNPVIFKLALGFNFSSLCPDGSKSFICLLLICPGEEGAECHIKRTDVSVGNFEKSPKRCHARSLGTKSLF